MTRGHQIKPTAKFWRRIRLTDVEKYESAGGQTDVHVRGQATPTVIAGNHAQALDRYFAERGSA